MALPHCLPGRLWHHPRHRRLLPTRVSALAAVQRPARRRSSRSLRSIRSPPRSSRNTVAEDYHLGQHCSLGTKRRQDFILRPVHKWQDTALSPHGSRVLVTALPADRRLQCRNILLPDFISNLAWRRPLTGYVIGWGQYDRLLHFRNDIMVYHRAGWAEKSLPSWLCRAMSKYGPCVLLLDPRNVVCSQGGRSRSLHIHCLFRRHLASTAMALSR